MAAASKTFSYLNNVSLNGYGSSASSFISPALNRLWTSALTRIYNLSFLPIDDLILCCMAVMTLELCFQNI